MERKIIQISAYSEGETSQPCIIALCSDGTVLGVPIVRGVPKAWVEFPPIPQPEPNASETP